MRKAWAVAAVLGWALVARGQWVLQDSGTTASFRGVDYVGGGVAWVSGTGGTVLRTSDMGKMWVKCAVPEGGEKLDFRGVQAFDAKTAVVMSSGPGDASRLYKTVDGCGTWKLVFLNPDKDGFWDALRFSDRKAGVLLGDPVAGRFYARDTSDGGDTWKRFDNDDALKTDDPKAGIFAASNSTIASPGRPDILYAIANSNGKALFFHVQFGELPCDHSRSRKQCAKGMYWWEPADTLLGGSKEGVGVFSIGITQRDTDSDAIVAVGGNYTRPNDRQKTASVSWGGDEWMLAETMPGGYRSAVEFEPVSRTWITVGPNGTDVSVDDGRNWRALTPGVGDAPDADKHWNALSLPFAVGEGGRIGILRSDATGAEDAKVSPR